MTTEIERYLNSLSEDILIIDISGKDIKSLPDLTKFKNLQKLSCSNNQLTSLPTLPQNLKYLYCSNNQLTSLPTLPQNLKYLYYSNNQLTSLLTLPQNLKELSCSNNQLTSLPTLPQNLEYFDCDNNQLTSLRTLPQNLEYLYCSNNPIYEIVNLEYFCEIINNDSLIKIKQNIQLLNNFRHLYYCLKFKKQLRKWLWEKVREPIVKKIYCPNYLIENLGQDDELDTVLDNWK
jgi:Leucine-rich repeat (LRR) protein